MKHLVRFFGPAAACEVLLILCGPPVVAMEEVVSLEPGRHLFSDDYLVAQSDGLKSTLHQPVKLGHPILKGMGSDHDNFQPYATVLYDEERERFRIWY